MADGCTDVSATVQSGGQKTSWQKCRGISDEHRTVFLLAFTIFLDTTAYLPVEALQSSLNREAGLGTYSIACLYGPYFIFALTAPCVVKFLTPKWTIVAQFAFDNIYFAANFYPTWYTLIPASVLIGSMTGPLWTAKDLYITKMARQSVEKSSQARRPDDPDFSNKYQSKLSFYNSIVFGAMQFALVVGQLTSSLVLSQSQNSAPSNENCGAYNCPNDVVILSNFTNSTQQEVLPEKYLVYTLLGILTSLVVFAVILTTYCLNNIPCENSDRSFKSTMLSCAVRCTDTKMLLMIPQIVFFAFPHGLIQSDYTKSYVSCGVGVGMVGYVMISGSLVATLASVGCGRLVKYTGRQIQVVMALFGYAGLHLMMWFWTPLPGDHMVLFFVVPMMFCTSDVIFQTHICSVIGVMFEGDKAAAFANFYTFRSLSKAVSFAFSGFLCVWIKLAISSVLLCLASVSFFVLEILIKYRSPVTRDETVVVAMLSPDEQNESQT